MDMQQAFSAGVGISIDPDGDAVVLVITGNEEFQLAAPMTPDVALAFARSMKNMAREAQMLQDELEDLSPEEIEDRLTAIHNRFAAENN